MITLSEAANRTGKSKQAIRKAIGKGHVRGEKDLRGQWQVDPASLFAVYTDIGQPSTNQGPTENNLLSVKLEAAEQQIESLKTQLSRLEDDKEDLRRRLDTESEERRKLTLMLTDQRNKQAPTLWQWLGVAKR